MCPCLVNISKSVVKILNIICMPILCSNLLDTEIQIILILSLTFVLWVNKDIILEPNSHRVHVLFAICFAQTVQLTTYTAVTFQILMSPCHHLMCAVPMHAVKVLEVCNA